MQDHVQLLNIGGLKLTTLNGLTHFYSLKQLLAADNGFDSPVELGKSLAKLQRLQVIDFRGCPAQQDIHYKEHVLGAAHHIRKTHTFVLIVIY